MTPSEQMWVRVNRRALELNPDIRSAILRAFQTIKDALNDSEIARMISTGEVDRIFDSVLSAVRIESALQPVRDQMRLGITRSFKYFARDIPSKGVTVAFDVLNPDVITAIRTLESKVLTSLQTDIREVVRSRIEQGLVSGETASTIARDLRSVIGLSPSQEEAVQNFRSMIENGDKEALTRKLRDKRFDGTLNRVFDGEGVSPQQLDNMVNAYRRKSVAYNAETVSRAASMSAQKLGQQLSMTRAVEMGVYDPERLKRRWRHHDPQPNPRPEHQAMNGETVPYDQPYSNGDNYAGEGDPWNCHCLDQFGNF